MSNEPVAGERKAFVQEALLQLDGGIDGSSVGAAVTVELCGHWEHHGACRWPHNNDIQVEGAGARFRTIFISAPGDEARVRAAITGALKGAPGVSVATSSSRPVAVSERALADRLLHYTGPQS